MNNKRFIVIVLDSFGVGEMADVKDYHPHDVGTNTAFNIIKTQPEISLPNLEKLGLMNAIGKELPGHYFNPQACFGTSNLQHEGADSFLGHQEIMGSLYKRPYFGPFAVSIDKVETALINHGYNVKRIMKEGLELLSVNDCATVGDNLETDGGRVYNVTGSFDLISFKDLKKIGQIVRDVVTVARVITFGGVNVTFDDITRAIRTVDGTYIGVDAPMSGVYNQGYQVIHMGYGVDSKKQVQTILHDKKIPVYLLGKFADVIHLEDETSYTGVESEMLLDKLKQLMIAHDKGLFCLNIQETDLAGHAQDVSRYRNRLELVDKALDDIIPLMNDNDFLVVTADHGNDPTIGHSNHTREKVPLLIKYGSHTCVEIGLRETMSDTAATIAEFFDCELPENGVSYLKNFR